MSIDDLHSFVVMLLAISLASERVVTFLKNLLPEVLADEKKNDASETDLPRDRWRRVMVQSIGFVAAWAICAFLTADPGWNPGGSMRFGENGTSSLSAWIVGLLASSGSALWSSVLGITSATKDLRKQAVASQGVEFKQRTAKLGLLPPVDAGEAGRAQGGGQVAGGTPAFDVSRHQLRR